MAIQIHGNYLNGKYYSPPKFDVSDTSIMGMLEETKGNIEELIELEELNESLKNTFIEGIP